jgi:hypothetical protein
LKSADWTQKMGKTVPSKPGSDAFGLRQHCTASTRNGSGNLRRCADSPGAHPAAGRSPSFSHFCRGSRRRCGNREANTVGRLRELQNQITARESEVKFIDVREHRGFKRQGHLCLVLTGRCSAGTGSSTLTAGAMVRAATCGAAHRTRAFCT